MTRLLPCKCISFASLLLFITALNSPLTLSISNAHEYAHEHEHGEPSEADVIKSTGSGNWSSPDVWSTGAVPQAQSKVLIQRGHSIRYDIESSEVIRGIQISGELLFARDRNTRLEVGLLRVEDLDHYSEDGFDCQTSMDPAHNHTGLSKPALEVGTALAPIPSEFTATIRLHYIEGMDKETCPAIISCGGRMDLHGAPLERTWVKLPYQTAKVGESKIVMPATLAGWKKGDRIILTGTTRQFGYIGTRYNKEGVQNSVAEDPTTEERIITGMRPWGGIDSKLQIVSLDKPLQFDHLGSGDYRGEVANLSRNVVVESAEPNGVRGHTMYHEGSQGSISYAEFRHLGKRDVLGKYPIHFHLTGDSMRGSSVIGASVWDSHNRWITIHGTQYLVVKDCVGYKSIGHGYFLEDGTEVYNILDNNLAVLASRGQPLPDQVLGYDKNLGSGFWWANSLNSFTNNVAAECDEDGFRMEVFADEHFNPELLVLQPDGTHKKVDIRTLPFVRFDGNEAHCQRLFGINLGGFPSRKPGEVNPDVAGIGPPSEQPFHLRNTKVWNTHWAFHCGAPSVRIEDFAMHDCAYGIWRCVIDRHEYLRLTFSQVNTTVFYPRSTGNELDDPATANYYDLSPEDTLPPITVITDVRPLGSDIIRVSGMSTDNYEIEQVVVNDRSATATSDNFATWQIDFPVPSSGELHLSAFARDVHENAETLVHQRTFTHGGTADHTHEHVSSVSSKVSQ